MPKELKYKMTLSNWGFTDQGHIKKILENELNLSKHEISRLKFDGEILVNGQPAKVNDHISIGDTLIARFPEDQTESIPLLDEEPDILYEEEDFVIVNKPAGIATHPSHGNQEISMGTILQSHYQKLNENFLIRPIGRLDKDVSGIVLFAKNQPAAARLTEDRENGKLTKKYTAIVAGVPSKKAARIRMPIEKVEGQIERVPSEEGQEASTIYHLIKELPLDGEEGSMLDVEIETGRTHQIRVHLKAIGYPLLGDSLYGGDLSKIQRPALHAREIDLYSPFTREPVHVEAPLPEDMERLVLMKPVVEEVVEPIVEVPVEQGVEASAPVEETSEIVTLVAPVPEVPVEKMQEQSKDDIQLNTGSIAVVKPKASDGIKKGLKTLLILLVIALLALLGYLFFKNRSNAEAERIAAEKQALADKLVLEFDKDPVVEYGSTFHAESYFKEHPGKLTMLGKLDTEKLGSQTIRFTLTDTAEDGETIIKEFEKEFTVVDTVKPEITFEKDEVVVLIGEQFNPDDNIKKVEDPIRGKLTKATTLSDGTYVVESNVNETVNGNYTVTVKAKDASGNTAEKSYQVRVGEEGATNNDDSETVANGTPKTMIWIHEKTITVQQDETYDPLTNIFNVYDDVEGPLQYSTTLNPGTYTLKSNVDTKKAGTYKVEINALNQAGNTDHDDFEVIVLPKENTLPTPTPSASPTQEATATPEPVATPTPTPEPTKEATATAQPIANQGDAFNQIYSFLTGNMGMNKAQAVGVLANMKRESNYQPTADNGIGYYGLCQWGGGRLENLKNWCDSNGYDYTTIDGQLHFLQMEIQSTYPNTYSQLMACEDTSDGAYMAGYIFGKGYEVAGETLSDAGGKDAQALYGN